MSLPITLTGRLREATRGLHSAAERAGVMPRLLRGELPLPRYVALLHQLHALYTALEAALAATRQLPGSLPLAPALARSAALQADLQHLDPQGQPKLVAPMRDYVAHLAQLRQGGVPQLAAHAYVRYLGDLAGGRALHRVVARSYGLAQDGLRFYAFDTDTAALGQDLRAQLDALPAAHHDPIVAEAQAAFRRHVDLFEALADGA
jgi:heme oxygenase